jgi:hypothetical protein
VLSLACPLCRERFDPEALLLHSDASAQTAASGEQPMCARHFDGALDAFCSMCADTVCEQCLVTPIAGCSHPATDLLPLDEAVAWCLSRLGQSAEDLRTRTGELEVLIERLRAMYTALQQRQSVLLSEIRAAFSPVLERLNQRVTTTAAAPATLAPSNMLPAAANNMVASVANSFSNSALNVAVNDIFARVMNTTTSSFDVTMTDVLADRFLKLQDRRDALIDNVSRTIRDDTKTALQQLEDAVAALVKTTLKYFAPPSFKHNSLTDCFFNQISILLLLHK